MFLKTSLPGPISVFLPIDREEVGSEPFGIEGLAHLMALKGISRNESKSITADVTKPAKELNDFIVTNGPRPARGQCQDKVIFNDQAQRGTQRSGRGPWSRVDQVAYGQAGQPIYG